MRKISIASLLAMTFLFVGCSNTTLESNEPVAEQKVQKQKLQSPIGSWGTAKGESIDVESKPWLLVTKDEVFQVYDGCYTVYGTWSKSNNIVDLNPQSKLKTSDKECKASWSGKADLLKVDGEKVTIHDFGQEELLTLKLVSRDTTLIGEAIAEQSMRKGAEIAEQIEGANITTEGKSSKAKELQEDTSYKKRFG